MGTISTLTTMEKGLSISAVERETGLSKDTLRVWEKRYGFPAPGRDARGERVYRADEVEKLIIIKRLIDRGARPAKVVALSLKELIGKAEAARSATEDSAELSGLVQSVRTHDVVEFRQQLEQCLLRQGLARFLQDTVAPLNHMVGDAWMRAELDVFQEHLYTEVTQALLRSAAAATARPDGTPRVLLTTLPGEQHLLGLLMAECMLNGEGATCIALGPQTPAGEIARAVVAQRADVVGLSFSPAYPAHTAFETLAALRAMLPVAVEIWAGGSNPALFRRRLDGVQPVRDLATIADAVNRWRTHRPA